MRKYSDMISKNDEGFFYKTIAAAMGLGPSIVLKQIGYWCWVNEQAEKHDTHFNEGRWWMFDTYAGLTKRNFPYWHKDTVRNYIKFLKELGLLRVGNFNKKGYDQTNWYSPDGEKINAFMAHWEQCGTPIRNGGGKQTPEYKAFIESWMEANKDEKVPPEEDEGGNDDSQNVNEEGGVNASQGGVNASQGGVNASQMEEGTVHTPIPESTSENTHKEYSKSRGADAPATPSASLYSSREKRIGGYIFNLPTGPVKSTGTAADVGKDEPDDDLPEPGSLEEYLVVQVNNDSKRYPPSLRKKLTRKRRIVHPDTDEVIDFPSLDEAYRENPLFRRWVGLQIQELNNDNNRPSSKHAVAKLGKGVKETKWRNGWVQWSRRERQKGHTK